MPRQVKVEPDVEEALQHWARTVLRVEMMRKAWGYRELAEKLDSLGYHENERNLRNKVARGEFSAGFMLLSLVAMGAEKIDVPAFSRLGERAR